jgi:Cu(I)/Ag(I) efflux system membrane fusion protein
MKNLFLFISLITIFACNPKNQQDESNIEESADQSESFHAGTDHAEKMVASLNVDKKFIQQLTEVYRANLDVKDALVDSDMEKAKKEAKEVLDKLGAIDHQLLKGEAHGIWMANLREIAHLLSKIQNAGSLDEERENFALLNKALYNSMKFLGYSGDPVYYQFCPMAFDNKGAYWLSSTEDIRNPYFGDQMLKCGETKEILQ